MISPRTITREEGKVIAEGRGEVQRAIQTITLSAEEAKRLHGETVPLDAAPGVVSQFGFTIRVPVGIVAAIAPFNFPLNLVCHKVGPALAGGNAVILKPAGDTPLSALKLTEILLEAGLPGGGHPDHHRLGRGDRRRHHRLARRAQDHLHRQHGGGGPDLPQRRHQEGHDGAGLQQPADHHVRRRH